MSAAEGTAAARQPAATAPQGLLAATLTVIRKDALLEWRGRARLNATFFFALLTLLLFSFALGPSHQMQAKAAAGFLWLAIFLASILSLSESMRIEQENDALEGLRLIPINPKAVFLGKALVNTLFLFILGLVLVPAAIAIYDVPVELGLWRLTAVILGGCAGISAPGTLQAAIAVQARARDVLLPLLLFPILIPGLVAAVSATDLIFHGDPLQRLSAWAAFLAGFVLIYWLLCTLLFGRVVE